MCLGGGGNPVGKVVAAREAREARDRQNDLLELSGGGLTGGGSSEPRKVDKDTRGSHENKEKLKPKLQQKTPGGNDGPSPFNPRSISDASRYMGGKDIGF